MNRKTVAVIAAVGLIAVVCIFAVAFLLVRHFSSDLLAPLQGTSAQTYGPGFGPGMMGGTPGQGQSPDGLTAVSPDGTPVPLPADNAKLPENTSTQKVGNLNVTLELNPYPPTAFKKTDFDITLVDDQGQAVTDANISLDMTMPGMRMPPNKLEALHTGSGLYQAAGMFTMRDLWRIEVIILRGGEKQSAFFDVGI